MVVQFTLDGSNFIYIRAVINYLQAFKSIGGAQTELGTIALDTTAHRRWRGREAGGTFYVDTSPNGLTWTNRFSCPTPWDMTSMQMQCTCYNFATEASGSYAIFDNVNITPVVKSGDGSGTYTWSSTTAGAKTSRGTASGTYAWAGTATGQRTPKATVSGTYTWSSTTAGTKTSRGTTTGAYTWTSTASR